MRGAYNMLRMAEGAEWKPAFRTRYGLFEYIVMPFRLTNAPPSFQHFVNDTQREFLGVYSDTMEKHKVHVRKVLEAFDKARIHLKPEKCEFFVRIPRTCHPPGWYQDATLQSRDHPAVGYPKKLKGIQEFLGFLPTIHDHP